MMKVGMQDLDKSLAKIVDHARNEPVQVLRYGRPWVWLVGHALWDRPSQVADLVPERHPLREVRLPTDAALSESITELYRLAQVMDLALPLEFVVRALLLQLLYAVRDEQELAERIGYDLTFRWFVGMELEQPVPQPQALKSSLQAALGQLLVVRLLQRLMVGVLPREAGQALGRLHPDYGLLSTWMAPFLEQGGTELFLHMEPGRTV
ncbi:transposase [Orrella sp. JC864]|uniref:transposase n=1 Tax=Orrella sp. JC864 TaxID=3120298 RepID=UPI00300B8559